MSSLHTRREALAEHRALNGLAWCLRQFGAEALLALAPRTVCVARKYDCVLAQLAGQEYGAAIDRFGLGFDDSIDLGFFKDTHECIDYNYLTRAWRRVLSKWQRTQRAQQVCSSVPATREGGDFSSCDRLCKISLY